MTTKSQVTAGSQLYVANLLVSPIVALLVPQLKGMSNVGGGARKKIDISNFDSLSYDELQGGRVAPGEVSGELVLDLTNTGHQSLKALFEAGASGTINEISFCVVQSGGSGSPSISAGVIVPPETASPKHWAASGFLGIGYVSSLMPKGADNDVWRADFKFQTSGKTSWFVKGDTIITTF